jgi:membrane-associated protease RseP (regulator of RpoE activity)
MLTNLSILFLFILSTVIIHELSHILTARAFGSKMGWPKFYCVNFDPTGFSKLDRWKKILVIIIGPMSSLIISILLFLFSFKDYALIAFVLFLFDLIPFVGSDIRNLNYYCRRSK